MVCTDWTGYAVPGADTANFTFEGIAIGESDVNGVILPTLEEIDNSAGANEDRYVIVQRHGRWRPHCDVDPLQFHMSGTCYIDNDQQVAVSPFNVANDVVCGRVSRVSWPGKPAGSDLIEVEFECGICAPYGRRVPTSTTAGG
jgi:hypothetical protein